MNFVKWQRKYLQTKGRCAQIEKSILSPSLTYAFLRPIFGVVGFGRGEVCSDKYFMFPGVYSTPAQNDWSEMLPIGPRTLPDSTSLL